MWEWVRDRDERQTCNKYISCCRDSNGMWVCMMQPSLMSKACGNLAVLSCVHRWKLVKMVWVLTQIKDTSWMSFFFFLSFHFQKYTNFGVYRYFIATFWSLVAIFSARDSKSRWIEIYRVKYQNEDITIHTNLNWNLKQNKRKKKMNIWRPNRFIWMKSSIDPLILCTTSH